MKDETEEAIAGVLSNEKEAWKAAFRNATDQFIAAQAVGAYFTGEDVSLWVTQRIGQPPHHYNSKGGMVRSALLPHLTSGRVIRTSAQREAQAKTSHWFGPVYRIAGVSEQLSLADLVHRGDLTVEDALHQAERRGFARGRAARIDYRGL